MFVSTSSPTNPVYKDIYSEGWSFSGFNGIWPFQTTDENGNPYYLNGARYVFFNTHWNRWIVGDTLIPSNSGISWYMYCECTNCDITDCQGNDWSSFASSSTALCYNNYCSQGGTTDPGNNTPSPVVSAPNPTDPPTRNPTQNPTRNPTKRPTTKDPTTNPTKRPTSNPTRNPTKRPTTKDPTTNPTKRPTEKIFFFFFYSKNTF